MIPSKPKSVKKLLLFAAGALSGIFVLALLSCILYENKFRGRVYPAVSANGFDVSGKTPAQIESLFETKSLPLKDKIITIAFEENIATFSGRTLDLSLNSKLAADQAMMVGRSGTFMSDIWFKIRSIALYITDNYKDNPIVKLSSAFSYDSKIIDETLNTFSLYIDVQEIEPQFEFDKTTNRVTTFSLGKNGRKLNINKAKEMITRAAEDANTQIAYIKLPVVTVYPRTKTEDIDTLGIVELIGSGESYFYDSIPGRIHNIALASSRVSGVLIAPNEVFSFNETIGDVDATTGYESAYIIKGGRTILGDGGGVCQVSTTVFRAALNAGLEIIERHPHSYRVSYYEQGGFKPGFDATVYSPSVDLKFKNNTDNYILLQSDYDGINKKLTYNIYGKQDSREVIVGDVVILSTSPAPPPLYQDDPTLAPGVVRQIEHAVPGAKTMFEYRVIKNGEILTENTFYSNFQPWQAVYLKGPEK